MAKEKSGGRRLARILFHLETIKNTRYDSLNIVQWLYE